MRPVRAYLDQAGGSDSEAVRKMQDTDLELRRPGRGANANDYRADEEELETDRARNLSGQGRACDIRACSKSKRPSIRAASARRELRLLLVQAAEEVTPCSLSGLWHSWDMEAAWASIFQSGCIRR